MKSGVIYARVSTKDQEQEGFSIPSQLKLLQEYAFRNGIEIVSEFIDVETAKTAGRTNFGEMLKFLKRTRNCRIVIVEKTDRLTRNLRDTVEIEDTGAEVHFVKEHKVISSKSCAQDKLVHNFNVVMATHYSNNLSEEVKKECGKKRNKEFILLVLPSVIEITKPITRLKFTKKIQRSFLECSSFTAQVTIPCRKSERKSKLNTDGYFKKAISTSF